MPKLLLLGLVLICFTLPVPLLVWAGSRSWRQGLAAWWWFGKYMLILYALGLLTWLGMGAPT